MKVIAMIPARLEASRFPKKLIQDLNGKAVIYHTVEQAMLLGLFDEVVVVADDPVFEEILQPLGIKVHRSEGEYECGSDRIAAFAHLYQDADVIINIQGDEPFVNTEAIISLIKCFEGKDTQVASVMHVLNKEEVDNTNFVKVVVNHKNESMLFSRSPIPYQRNKEEEVKYYRHVGIYAFRPQVLSLFSQWPLGTLEKIEQIEALRFLENGYPIKMSEISSLTIGIDTPEDLEKAKKIMKS